MDGLPASPPGSRRRLLVVLSLAVVPWTVVVYPGGYDLIFPWGLVNTDPLHLVRLDQFLFVYTAGPESLPDRLLAWPVATVLYAVAVATAVLGALDLEDRRVTAALLVLSGLVHFRTTTGLSRIGELAVPVGPALALVVAWWVYAGDP